MSNFPYISVPVTATPILSTYQRDFISQDVKAPKSFKHRSTTHSLRKWLLWLFFLFYLVKVENNDLKRVVFS